MSGTVSIEVIIGFVGVIGTLLGIAVKLSKAQNALFEKMESSIRAAILEHSQNAEAHKDIRKGMESQKIALGTFIEKDEQWKKDHEEWGRELVKEMKAELLDAIQNHKG